MTNPCAEIVLTVRSLLNLIAGKQWNAPIHAVTEHGSHRFEVVAVEGVLGEPVVLRLKTILPAVVEDKEGDTWGLQSDSTYSVINIEANFVASPGSRYSGYSLKDIEREYGLKL